MYTNMNFSTTLLCLLLLAFTFMGCDNSTSAIEEEEEVSTRVLRVMVSNTGDAAVEFSYDLLITNPTGQESLSGNMSLLADESVPSVVGVSEPGATGLNATLTITEGTLKLYIEDGEIVDGEFQGETIMSTPGGAGQTVTLEYSGY